MMMNVVVSVVVSAWHVQDICPNNPYYQLRFGVPATATPHQHLTTTTTRLFLAAASNNKLWDRLQIEEDEEPMWYLLNCVATNELDLLRQCRQKCANLPDAVQQNVVKFVVPLERKTRSHGAKKMVTDVKVKYPGYVFAKLRLCPPVYEAIQGLDLCRSWMGTVNHKGYQKLPPAPLALNDEEIQNFGLDDISEDVDNDPSSSTTNSHHHMDADGIIMDSSDDDDDDILDDPMYQNIDKKSLKQYQGFKVEDMVKVTKSGKFYNEDGIVRRLKDGQLLVRFYTYGTMFEEWMSPGDVRKLSPDEVLRGLSGATQPITQQDFDQRLPRDATRPMDVREALRSSPGRGNDRNRRQDRVADRFKSQSSSNINNAGRYPPQRDRADENWKWYQEQQQQQRKPPDSVVGVDDEWSMRAGSRHDDQQQKWVQGDVDSQWGRRPSPQERQRSQNQDRTADWSAFVTTSPNNSNNGKDVAAAAADQSKRSPSDDFFASLMSDLNQDLSVGSSVTPRDNQRTSTPPPPPNQAREPPPRSSAPETKSNAAADDFFSSLMSDLNKDLGGPATNQRRSAVPNVPPSIATTTTGGGSSSEDDFFASLMSDLNTSPTPLPLRNDGSMTTPTMKQSTSPNVADQSNDYVVQQDDDFFASLEAELETSLQNDRVGRQPSANRQMTPSITETPSNVEQSDPPTASRIPSPSGVSDLNKSTIPVLKELLRERGLKVSGTKAELIERLSNNA